MPAAGPSARARLARGFRLTGRRRLEYALDLRGDEVDDLVRMLPATRRNRAGHRAVHGGALRTTVGVTLLALAPG